MNYKELIENSDKEYIIGIDEVGMGCLAGPIFVCAFKAPKDFVLAGLRDSKKLSKKKKQDFKEKLEDLMSAKEQYFCSMQIASNNDIDHEGLSHCVHTLYFQSLKIINLQKDSLILVDGKRFKEDRYEYEAIVGGDDLVPHISAASVLAKFYRDQYMTELDQKHPEYDWKNNMGYGSPKHLAALETHGITPYHRLSFKPMKDMINE